MPSAIRTALQAQYMPSAIRTALQAQYMPSTTEEIFEEIARSFNISWNFPNCIESTDAKHMRIHCAPKYGSPYFNYKECHSIVLQAVVDEIF